MKKQLSILFYLLLFLYPAKNCFADENSDFLKYRQQQQTQKNYETTNYSIVEGAGSVFKVWIYNDYLVVGTVLKGPNKGAQSIFFNGKSVANADKIIKKKNHTIHFYSDGKIITYKNKQKIEIY